MNNLKVSFIGGGNMACALIGGMITQGFLPANIQVIEPQKISRMRLEEEFAARALERADAEFFDCDVIVLAVKPQQMREALAPVATLLSQNPLRPPLILSIAAGLHLDDITRWLGGYRQLVRAMPNTPALIGQGMTGLYAGGHIKAEPRSIIEQIVRAVGEFVWVEDETQIDAVTAISGSGPAYVFYFIEALQAAGQKLGLTPEVARALALQTVQGAAQLAINSEEGVATLRERVTSKGGTTQAALDVLQSQGFFNVIETATQAANTRAQQMGKELGQA